MILRPQCHVEGRIIKLCGLKANQISSHLGDLIIVAIKVPKSELFIDGQICTILTMNENVLHMYVRLFIRRFADSFNKYLISDCYLKQIAKLLM